MSTNRRDFGKLGVSAAFALGASPAFAESTAPATAPATGTDFRPQYELDVPTKEAAQRIFDELAYQRAVQVYLWGLSAVGMQQYRTANAAAMGGGPDDYKLGYLGEMLK